MARRYWLAQFCLVAVLLSQVGFAQSVPPAIPFCGTAEQTARQSLDLIEAANRARQQKIASGEAFQAVTYIPIRPHIFRRSNGTGGYSLASLNNVMALTNSYYLLNGAGIQFFFAGTAPNYIDNDDMFTSFGNQSVDGYDAPNAMNQYYVNQFSNAGLGGYAYYPYDALYTTRSFILNEANDDDMGNRLVPHELGHNFNLIHTFGQYPGNGTLGSGTTLELVTRGAGANCPTEGDYICDTPADPYNMVGANLSYQNGCPFYDPASTARDANGVPYAPSITNIMSYYFPCTHEFTPGQQDRIQAGLALRQSHASYSLNAPPTAVTAPGNLTAVGQQNGTQVRLTWQDNATNEMGYFIERSTTSATAGFVPIGGVAPNVTTFTDTKTILNTQYYYRIRPSNTTTGSLSPTLAFRPTIPVLTGLRTTNISATAAQLSWDYPGSDYTYDIQWRPAGSSVWNTISLLYTTSYTLANLTLDVAYEWRVKITGGPAYTGPVSFTTTTCPVPVPYATYPGPTTASLGWDYIYSRIQALQWRPAGTPAWTTVEGISSTVYSLTGLTTQTPYEWRVRGICPDKTTDYSPIQSFTTLTCPIPVLTPGAYNSSSFSVYWTTTTAVPNQVSTLRYRPTGTTGWTQIEGLLTSFYSLTGLTTGTTYEIQVETVCSSTERSGFSTSLFGTPACQLPTYLNSQTRASSTTLSWNTANPRTTGTTFDLQYRPAGATVWTTQTSLTTVSPSTNAVVLVTGLAANTTYEWRVRASCPGNFLSDYVAGPPFTTACLAPVSPSFYALSTTSVTLSWTAFVEAGTPFDIRYRPAGTPTWTTVSNVLPAGVSANFSYLLTGLTNGTTYNWEVRTACSATDNSVFVAGTPFTTGCLVPNNLSSSPTLSSVSLSWTTSGAAMYELRYRKTGSADWINVGSLTTTGTSLTGLLSGTSYEWQVRSLCNGNFSSDFTASNFFSTATCTTPYYLYTSDQSGTSAKLNWYLYTAASNARFDVRYRVVGTPDWQLISNLPGASSTNGSVVLTGLTPDVQYEWQVRTVCSESERSAFSPSALFSTCSQQYTVKSGTWSDPSVWYCNRVPTATDVVQIRHIVDIPTGYTATARSVRYEAPKQLIFGQNAKLKLGQ